MKDKVKKLCLDCNHRCEDMAKCDFRPREDLIGKSKQHIHLDDRRYQTKEKNSEICVVCKDVAKNYFWIKLLSGYYVFCESCKNRHFWINENLAVSEAF